MKGCRSCTHWQATDERLEREDPATAGQKVQIGLCRRFAPRPLTTQTAVAAEASWPRVASDDWCGEWEPRVL